jgi:RNA polymerase sigma-70 factor (ECF subfamily)
VREAVDGLEEIYRAVVVLLYDQQLSYEQIAEVLGVPVKTVETRLYRARRRLRETLGGRPGGAAGREDG